MSWDLVVFRFTGKPPANAEEIDESRMEDFGPPAKLREEISHVLPEVNWSDPTWGDSGRDGVSIEFNIGDKDIIKDIMLHVRGSGDALGPIATLAKSLGWSVLDGSTGEFIDLKKPGRES